MTLLIFALVAVAAAGGAWLSFAHRAQKSLAVGSRLLVAPFENLTGDPRLDHIGRIAADRLALAVAQASTMDIVPSSTVLMALRDTGGGQTERLKRLADATHAGLMVSGTIVLRGDSLTLQAQVTNVRTGEVVVTLDPSTGVATDPIAALDALGDRLLGALGSREQFNMPHGIRAPKHAAYQEFAKGFERFAVHGDNVGSRPFFERAIAIDSTYTRAYELLGRQYFNAGEYERADSMVRRIERLPQGLYPSERLQLEATKADLSGDITRKLRTVQQLVALDSSALALLLVGVTATYLVRPDIALPALERAEPTYRLMGGAAARRHAIPFAEAYQQAGMHDRELRTLMDKRAMFPDVAFFRGRQLRAYAGLAEKNAEGPWRATAVALADTILRGGDSSGIVLTLVTTGAQEFRAHGDAGTASRLLAMARAWIAAHPARAPSTDRQFAEALVMLAVGMPDSAAARVALVARDTTRLEAAGYLALAHAARGDRARARAIADSLGALRRRWLFGEHTFWRAAIMGALGDRDLAVQLLQQANREGQPMQTWHYRDALQSLHGYVPFESLIRPQR